MLALVHCAPQPAWVAGPIHTMPCSRRHFLGSGMISQGRTNFFTFFSSLVFRHSSQQVLGRVPTVAPLGGRFPDNRVTMTSQIRSAIGGHPGMKYSTSTTDFRGITRSYKLGRVRSPSG